MYIYIYIYYIYIYNIIINIINVYMSPPRWESGPPQSPPLKSLRYIRVGSHIKV